LKTQTVSTLLREGVSVLERTGLPTARQDAEWLLAHLLRVERRALYLEPERPVAPEAGESFAGLLARRRQGEPLQHLLGWEEFCGLRLQVTPEALIPRPETELLVEWALEILRGSDVSERHGLVVDLGTGSGAIACALARSLPYVSVLGIDISAGALAVAAENIRSLGLDKRVRLVRGDLFGPFTCLEADLVIANPPYIASSQLGTLPAEVREYEPRQALDGGLDGMMLHWRIISEAPAHLGPGGWLLMEVGEGQAGPLARAINETGAFKAVEVRRDLSRIDRMIGARRR